MILAFKQKIGTQITNFPIKIFLSLEMSNTICGNDYNSFLAAYLDSNMQNVHISKEGRIRPKLHTIREDIKNRWKAGNDIHFVVNNRSKHYLQFAPIVKCTGVQYLRICYGLKFSEYPLVFIDNRRLSLQEIRNLAHNDGFASLEDFFKWFDKDFKGKIIHWTKTRY